MTDKQKSQMWEIADMYFEHDVPEETCRNAWRQCGLNEFRDYDDFMGEQAAINLDE